MQLEEPKPAERVDTSPMVRARRIKRQVRIREVNNPPSTLFDTAVEYPSEGLPEWFAGLQAIVEDETFTSMDINLGGGKVRYFITIVESEGSSSMADPPAYGGSNP